MNGHNIAPKRFFATALLTTGLLGGIPLLAEQIALTESFPSAQEQISPQIDSHLCNKQFQCSKTGLVIQFLPNDKALFMHPVTSQTLNADYTVHFNRHITMNVYENPSKNFDLMMKNVTIDSEGFIASINQEDRYFQNI